MKFHFNLLAREFLIYAGYMNRFIYQHEELKRLNVNSIIKELANSSHFYASLIPARIKLNFPLTLITFRHRLNICADYLQSVIEQKMISFQVLMENAANFHISSSIHRAWLGKLQCNIKQLPWIVFEQLPNNFSNFFISSFLTRRNIEKWIYV